MSDTSLLASFGGRKYSIVMVCLIWIAACDFFKVQIHPPHLDFLWKVIAVFMTANVTVDFAGAVKAWLAKPKTADEKAELVKQLEDALAKAKAS